MAKSVMNLRAKDWREKRAKLVTLLKDTCLRSTRIVDGGVTIRLEGGSFPAIFSFETQELTIWGRCNKYAGRHTSIAELVAAEEVLRIWFQEEIENM